MLISANNPGQCVILKTSKTVKKGSQKNDLGCGALQSNQGS